MKPCEQHWGELRKAIEDRGLGQFIAYDGQAAGKRMVDNKFEPLMGAFMVIVRNAAGWYGIEAIAIDGCVLCDLIENCTCGLGEKCDFKQWIDHAADGQLADAQKLGLVATA